MQIYNKYKSLSMAVKASLWFTVCNLLQKGIQFITVPILTRMMPAEEYGEYSVFLSWYQIISIFATLNMWNYVMNNGMMKYENDRDSFVSCIQGLSTLITLMLFTIYLPFAGAWEKATSLNFGTMLIMFIELLLMPSFEYWCSRARYEFRYKSVVVFSMAIAVLVPLVSIPLVYISSDKGSAAIIGRTLTSAAVYLVPTIMIACKGKKFYNKDYWRFALGFNLPLVPHFLSIIILQQSDRIMISNMVGDDKAGIYSVAYSAAMVLQIVNSAILASFIPTTYNCMKKQDYKKINYLAKFLLLLTSFLNLALISVAPEAIKILGPEEYIEAEYIIPPVAISGIFMFMFNLFANIEYYFEETKYVAVASIGAAVSNLILNYIFIKIFGYIAAGYTTLVCYILYSLGHYIFMKIVCNKHLNGKKIYNAKFMVLLSVISIAASFIIMTFYNLPLIRYSILAICIIISILNRKKIICQLKMIKEK